MADSPITGYVVVLRYSDRSGMLGAFGPYPTDEAAKAGIASLKLMPMAEGEYEVLPLFGSPGSPAKKHQPVYRTPGGTDG